MFILSGVRHRYFFTSWSFVYAARTHMTSWRHQAAAEHVVFERTHAHISLTAVRRSGYQRVFGRVFSLSGAATLGAGGRWSERNNRRRAERVCLRFPVFFFNPR